MSFIDQRFPEMYAYGCVASDDWRVEIVETLNRREQRNAPIAHPRRSWDLSTTGRIPEERTGLHQWFLAMRGPLHAFAFRDPADFRLTRSVLTEGDGGTSAFQLTKAYTIGSETYQRPLTLPVTSTVRVWVNAVEQSSGWIVDRLTGIVSFSSAPADGAAIEAACDFDVPVRFAQSRLSWRAPTRTAEGLLWYCDALELIEVFDVPCEQDESSPPPEDPA